jgi:hypothetical protein
MIPFLHLNIQKGEKIALAQKINFYLNQKLINNVGQQKLLQKSWRDSVLPKLKINSPKSLEDP